MVNKETIILATLDLACEKGLGNISLSQIADKIGIQKPGLYNHFKSKSELIEGMYEYVRNKAKEKSGISTVDYRKIIEGKTAYQVLYGVVSSYISKGQRSEMAKFFKVVKAESNYDSIAAKIMVEETNTMILATKHLFYEMQECHLLHFSSVNASALIFAMTINSLMNYNEWATESKMENMASIGDFIEEFVKIYEEK